MKSLLVIISAFIFSHQGVAQNVGIGTTSPQATLDIKGNQRLGGGSHFMTYDSLGGKIEWIGSSLFVPVSQRIISHSASAEGLYAGGGKLEYRNISAPVFFSDWTNGNGYFKGNLGINYLTPQFPLSFNGSLGDKISLWTDGTPTHYGFGIQSGLLQMFSKTNFDDIAFGYGSSASFVEAMRIKGNGNVGIGTSAPYSSLTFNDNFGEKISMFGNAAGNFGFGVQSGLFQIHSDNIGSDIGIGTGSSASFNEIIRIKGAGYVGIGNTAPAAKLHIESSDPSSFPQLRLHQANGGDFVRARLTNANTNSNSRYWDIAAYVDASAGSSDRLNFYNNAVGDVVSLTGNGRVGLGTGNPLSNLHVYSGGSGNLSPFFPMAIESNTNTYINLLSPNANETGILFGKAENAASGGIVYNSSAVPSMPNGFQFRVNGNQTVASLNSAGNMGIGTSPTQSRVTIGQTPANNYALWLYLINSSGNGEYHWQMGIGPTPVNYLFFTANNTTVSYIDNVTGNYVAISDKIYKEDIQTLPSVLPKIMEMNPVSYRMKQQVSDEITYGFIAQELQQVFPDAVKKFGNEGRLGISYTQLIPLTVAAIQEQQRTIEELQQQIGELKKLVEKLLKQ